MGKSRFILLALMLLFCSGFLVNAQTKRAKTKSQKAKNSVGCKSGNISFPCPKEYKVLLNDTESSGIFLAKSTEFSYGVFVIAPKSTFDEQSFITETTKILLKTLYPSEFQDYRWKGVKFASDNGSSKFEIDKKLLLGFNGNIAPTLEYRHISFKDKNFVVGTIVDGFFKGYPAESDFNNDRHTTNGGCVDVDKIIIVITGEKANEKFTSCSRAKIIESIN